MAYEKPAPKTGEFAGEYAAKLCDWNDEEKEHLQELYAERAKSVGEDFTAESFFVGPDSVGMKYNWLDKEWLKNVGGECEVMERNDYEAEAEKVEKNLDKEKENEGKKTQSLDPAQPT